MDDFSEHMQVMADDPTVRGNRLALLARLRDLFPETDNISRLKTAPKGEKPEETLGREGERMMNRATEASCELLERQGPNRTKGNIRSDIRSILEDLGEIDVGTIETRYQLKDEQVDIYLPNRRCLIEVRRASRAKDLDGYEEEKGTLREQIDRRIQEAIQDEIDLNLPLPDSQKNSDWKGIITDGENWHICRYPNERNSKGTHEETKRFTTGEQGEELKEFLVNTLGPKKIGLEWIPERPGNLFLQYMKELKSTELNSKEDSRILKAEAEWSKIISVAEEVPEDEDKRRDLFLTHSLLIAIVRMISCTLETDRDTKWREHLKEGKSGLKSPLDWTHTGGGNENLTNRIWKTVREYDWQRRKSADVLRDLYRVLENGDERKLFGEFYTPDWLGQMVAEEALDEEWMERSAEKALKHPTREAQETGVLDLACGSGAFLYHSSLRIASYLARRTGQNPEKREIANIITQLVTGFDIHPIAAEMAQVNLQRALPWRPDRGLNACTVYRRDATKEPDRYSQLGEQKFDRIISNPPWNGPNESFRQDTRKLYLADPEQDTCAWIVKRSESTEKRQRQTESEVSDKVIDLREIQPFGSGDEKQCCILVENPQEEGFWKKKLLAVRMTREYPKPQEQPKVARSRFKIIRDVRRPGRISYTGRRRWCRFWFLFTGMMKNLNKREPNSSETKQDRWLIEPERAKRHRRSILATGIATTLAGINGIEPTEVSIPWIEAGAKKDTGDPYLWMLTISATIAIGLIYWWISRGIEITENGEWESFKDDGEREIRKLGSVNEDEYDPPLHRQKMADRAANWLAWLATAGAAITICLWWI